MLIVFYSCSFIITRLNWFHLLNLNECCLAGTSVDHEANFDSFMKTDVESSVVWDIYVDAISSRVEGSAASTIALSDIRVRSFVKGTHYM